MGSELAKDGESKAVAPSVCTVHKIFFLLLPPLEAGHVWTDWAGFVHDKALSVLL